MNWKAWLFAIVSKLATGLLAAISPEKLERECSRCKGLGRCKELPFKDGRLFVCESCRKLLDVVLERFAKGGT